MSFKKIVFVEPVESLSGKRNKSSKTCFFQGRRYGQRAWGLGERDLVAHPKTDTEKALNLANSAIFKAVAARRNDMSSTYTADLMAFNAQKSDPNGKQTFQQYLYWDERKKYAQAHPGVF